MHWCQNASGSASSDNISEPQFQRRSFMKIGLIMVVILLVLALILGSSYVGRRNQIAIKREAVNAAWAQVDVVLQRRADLIPNLVETVKGMAVQEQIVFGDIAKARSALLSAHTPAEIGRASCRERV